ncbi:MAG: flavin reductase family protein [Pseudomonadota bacterium]
MDAVRMIDIGQDPASDARTLRDAFGCFTTGVTIVTTLSGTTPVGFTVNSFASVSLDPPLALICVGRGASCLPALEASAAFVVNVLHVGQEALARQFTRKEGDRFEGVTPGVWLTGAPVLPGCLANFECETHQAFDAGDHRVIVGRVLRVRCDAGQEPLVFLRGGYRKVHLE